MTASSNPIYKSCDCLTQTVCALGEITVFCIVMMEGLHLSQRQPMPQVLKNSSH